MIIDLTKPIYDGMPVYPGDPQVSLIPISSIGKDGYENHLFTTSMHSGTHIDGPRHFIEGQPYISDFKLDNWIGTGRMMMPKKPFIYQGETILFIQTNTVLQEELIDFILKHPIKVIVIERESPDEAPYDTHQRLLSAGVFIVENAIHMNQIPLNQPFKAYIIPLNIHADSSPCRVFVEI